MRTAITLVGVWDANMRDLLTGNQHKLRRTVRAWERFVGSDLEDLEALVVRGLSPQTPPRLLLRVGAFYYPFALPWRPGRKLSEELQISLATRDFFQSTEESARAIEALVASYGARTTGGGG